MLANQQAKAVTKAGLTILVTIVSIRRGRTLIQLAGGVRSGGPAEFLDRAEADAVGFAEGAVNGPGLGDSHFGAVDQRRNVGGVGVAVADEPARARRLVYSRLEDPAARGWI
jgi:hypothetical protein